MNGVGIGVGQRMQGVVILMVPLLGVASALLAAAVGATMPQSRGAPIATPITRRAPIITLASVV